MVTELLTLVALATATTNLGAPAKPPLEADAALDGADALDANIGTLGFQQGLMGTYRHIGPPQLGDTDSFLLAYSPFPFVTLGTGVEYVRPSENMRYLSGAFALAIRPTDAFTFSAAVHPFLGMSRLAGADLSTWDIGIGFRPARWLSLSGAIENLNWPQGNGLALNRTYAFSAALRPFRTDLLTLGSNVRLLEDLGVSLWPAPRFFFDLRPTPWLLLSAAASTKAEFFLGLGLRERHAEAELGLGATRANGLDGSYVVARLRSVAQEGFSLTAAPTVEFTLDGDLRPGETFDFLLQRKRPFGEILLEMKALAKRSDIKRIRLVIGQFSTGLATLHELREGILLLRRHGKRVIAELSNAGDRELYVASAADKIIMQPAGMLTFNGLRLTLRYFKNLLDKLGVKVEAATSGPYKNSPDAYTRSEPSDAQLEAQNALLDLFYHQVVAAISQSRGIPQNDVESLTNHALFSGEEARAAHLVDDLTWPADPSAKPPALRYGRLENAGNTHLNPHLWNHPAAVALVQIRGLISSGEDFEDPFGLLSIAGANSVVAALEAARTDPDVKAVAVRIDSPGGDILASDLIWQAMRRVKQVKPLVVSMGDLAASGGYYAALPADVIFAEPETITGSIGVFNIKVDLSGLLDKLGIAEVVLKRGAYADLFDLTRPLPPGGREVLQADVDEAYRGFKAKVAAARGLSLETVQTIAQGRVWTGEAALERHLVDRLGGLLDALAEAERRAGYEKDQLEVRPFPDIGSPYHRFASSLEDLIQAKSGIAAVTAWVARVAGVLSGRATYLFPYDVKVD